MKTNKSDYLNLNSMNHILSEISRCDVILRCGKEKFIGMLYDISIAEPPIIKCKGEYDFNYYLMKVGEMLHVPCVEHKLLVRELFDKVEVGDDVPPEYYNVLATVYAKLEKFKDRDDDHENFKEKLTRDLGNQIYPSEKRHYKKVLQKTLRRKELQQQRYEGDIVKLFEEELKKLSEKFEVNFRANHNAVFKTDEFYLETIIKEYGLEFWQMVFISQVDKKIIIGTRHFFKIFDFSEAIIALEVFKAFADECYTDLEKNIIDFCEKTKTNPRLCEIAENTIKTMLKMNYQETGIEYGFYHDTVMNAVYLRPANSSVMYALLIKHQELLKSPMAFKEAIRDPKSMDPKIFCCKEMKYNPRKLDEKFRQKIKEDN